MYSESGRSEVIKWKKSMRITWTPKQSLSIENYDDVKYPLDFSVFPFWLTMYSLRNKMKLSFNAYSSNVSYLLPEFVCKTTDLICGTHIDHRYQCLQSTLYQTNVFRNKFAAFKIMVSSAADTDEDCSSLKCYLIKWMLRIPWFIRA